MASRRRAVPSPSPRTKASSRNYEATFRRGHEAALESIARLKSLHELDKHGFTLLGAAAWFGHAEACAQLLDRGTEIDAKDSEGRTALHRGIDSLSAHEFYSGAGIKAAVGLLLERGANVNGADAEGRTALHLALRCIQSPEVVEDLLARGADVHARTAWGSTPLLEAAEHGDHRAVAALLRSGADPQACDDDGQSALYRAAISMRGDREAVVEDLVARGVRLDAVSAETGQNVLMAAAYRLDALVGLCIQAGVDVHALDGHCKTALHCAVAGQDARIVARLLEAGASPNAADDDKRTPLHLACSLGNPEIAALLLRYGADSGAKDAKRLVPLALAKTAAIPALVASGLPPPALQGSAPDSRGRTPLMRACASRDVLAVQAALDRGEDVNAQDKWGKSALLIVLDQGHYGEATRSILALLWERCDLDVSLATQRGVTALHLALNSLTKATDERVLPIVEALLARGADPRAPDSAGRKPVDIDACLPEIRALLVRRKRRGDV